MQETQGMWVWSLGWEDPMKTEIATDSCILAWKLRWTEEPGRLQSMVSQRVRHDLECRHLIVEASLVAQKVKNLPTVWETGFDPWVGKIPWRREWLSIPIFLPWRISRTEEPGGPQSVGSQRVRHDWVTNTFPYSLVAQMVKNLPVM